MKLTETVDKVIQLGQKIRAYYELELPKWHPKYPLVGPGEEGPPPPAEEAELRQFLATLPPETIHQLILLMYLGREDFGADDLAGYYEELRGTLEPKEAVGQMLHSAPLADYLADGLEVLRQHNIDVDNMLRKQAAAPKR
jgi:hypothetical protein